MNHYTSLAPEVETPHAKDFRVALLKQLTEQHGPDYVRSERPELLYAAEVVNGAISAFGMEWLERHYPAHAKHYRAKSALLDDFFDGAVTAELQRIQSRAAKVPAPVPTEKSVPAPAVAEIETPKVSISADCLMPSIAPAFRGLAPVPALITSDDGRKTLANRRETDIAYLHSQGHRAHVDSSLCGGKFKGMLTGDTLDLDLVREFAAITCSKTSRWSDEHIAERVLFVPANLQAQLCQLATEAIKRKRARVINEAPAIRAKLENSMRKSGDAKNLKHAGLWAQLWVCDELIKFACGRRSPQEVGLLLGAMTGTPMARSDVAKKLRAIDARL